MCDISTLVWPNELLCVKEFGSCISGECKCHSGYQHDFASLRFRDCRQPTWFMPTFEGIFLAITVLSLGYTLYHVRTAKYLARNIILSAIGLQIMSILLAVARFSQQHRMTAISFFFFYFNVSFAFLCAYLSVYSMAGPLYRLSQTPIRNIQLPLKISFIFFRIIDAIPALIASILYNDPSNPANDYGWNLCSSFESLFYAIEMIGMLFAIIINGFRMIATIEKIAKDLPANDNSGSTTNYLNRVRSYLKLQFYFSPLLILVALSQPVIFFATGYFPYTYVIYALSEMGGPYFAVNQTKFAISAKDSNESRTPTKTTSSRADASNSHAVVAIASSDPNN